MKRRAKRRPKKSPNGKISALAKALGLRSREQVWKLAQRGMPTDSVTKARAWRKANVRPAKTGAVASETQRLRAAQAHLAELEARRKLGDVIALEDVRIAFSEAMVIVGSQLDGLGGRCAAQLAGMTDAAEIRRFLLNETRRIRAAAADRLKSLGGGSAGG